MLFGQQKQRGLFGAPQPQQMPMSGQDMTPTMAPDAQAMADPQAMPQPAAQGMFGAKKPGIPWMGMLADGLAGLAGKEGPYAAMMMQQQRDERLAQHAAAQRQASMEDSKELYRYQQDNKAPVQNDTVRDFDWYKGLSAEDRATYDQFRPVTMMTPEGPILAPRSSLGGSPAQPSSPPAIGSVIPDPRKGGAGGKPAGGRFPVNANGFVPPSTLAGGHMTSGRRTVEGNRAVGGVENSPHLSGASADYAGPDLQAILEQARKFPGIKRAFIHNAGSGKHVHTEGEGWNTPFYGKNGTRGR